MSLWSFEGVRLHCKARHFHNFGGHSGGETPLPIPNREVKPTCADGTRRATSRESRSPPISFARNLRFRARYIMWARLRVAPTSMCESSGAASDNVSVGAAKPRLLRTVPRVTAERGPRALLGRSEFLPPVRVE